MAISAYVVKSAPHRAFIYPFNYVICYRHIEDVHEEV